MKYSGRIHFNEYTNMYLMYIKFINVHITYTYIRTYVHITYTDIYSVMLQKLNKKFIKNITLNLNFYEIFLLLQILSC